jgi:hypothetical protein
MPQEVYMTKVIAAAVLSFGVAFAAAALAQQSRSTPAVTLHVVSPTGEAATIAIDHGDITLAVADSEIRLGVRGDALVRPASADGTELQVTNPTLVFSRSLVGSQGPVFQLTADRVTKSRADGH